MAPPNLNLHTIKGNKISLLTAHISGLYQDTSNKKFLCNISNYISSAITKKSLQTSHIQSLQTHFYLAEFGTAIQTIRFSLSVMVEQCTEAQVKCFYSALPYSRLEHPALKAREQKQNLQISTERNVGLAKITSCLPSSQSPPS